MIYCARHSGREAAHHCRQCQKGFCAECAREKKISTAVMHLCPVCNQPMTRLAPFRLVLPYWRRLPGVMAFPFRGAGKWLVLTWAVVGAALLGSPAAMIVALHDQVLHYHDYFNLGAFGLYFAMLTAICHRIIAHAADGSLDFPGLETREDPYERFKQMVPRVVWPPVAVLLPAVPAFFIFWSTYHQDPSPWLPFFIGLTFGVFILIVAIGLFLLPMAMLLVNVTGNIMNALDPRILYRQVGVVRRDYLALWAGLLVLAAAYAGFRLLLEPLRASDSVPLVFLAYAADGGGTMYLALVSAHVLGSLYHLNRFKLRWFAVHDHAPVFMVDGKLADMMPDDPRSVRAMEASGMTAATGAAAFAAAAVGVPTPAAPDPAAEEKARAAEHIKEAAYLIEHGNYEGAAERFRAALEHDPENFEALRGLAQAAIRTEDWDTLTEAGRKIGAELIREGASEAVWDMYHGYREVLPGFTFAGSELLALASWLDREGQPLEAARLLRELAVTFPDSAEAPAALLECGRLLNDRCGLPDKARSVWRSLMERYPGSEPARQANQLLEAPASPRDDSSPEI